MKAVVTIFVFFGAIALVWTAQSITEGKNNLDYNVAGRSKIEI